MSLGQNLREYRLEKKMTQKDLADTLFVSAQAVSRWENDEVEPSIDMLKSIATTLGISVETLINGKKEEKEEADINEIVVTKIEEEIKPIQKEQPINQCVICHKDLFEGDAIYFPKTYHRSGRTTKTTTKTNEPRCESCHRKEKKAKEDASLQLAHSKSKKHRIHGFIWGTLGGLLALGAMLYATINGMITSVDLVGGIFLSILFGYALFALIFCAIVDNNFIGELFGNIVGFSVRLPGLIFTLDLEGILWLLTVKLFLFILGVIGSILLFILALVVCGALAIFVFPFALHWTFSNPKKTGTGSDL